MIPSGSTSVEMLANIIAANSTIVGKKTLDPVAARAAQADLSAWFPLKPPRFCQ